MERGGGVTRYKLKTEDIALNVARTKFIILTPEKAMTCRMNALGVCPSRSLIY